MKKHLISACFVLASSVAQAGLFSADGKDDNCTEDHSFAWCVLDYLNASQGVRDGDTLKGNYGVKSPDAIGKSMEVLGVGLGVGQMAGVISTPPGISPMLGGTAFILMALSSPTSHADSNHILVLMPPEIAKDDPLSAILETFGKAGLLAFDAESYETIVVENKPKFGPINTQRTLSFKGGACVEKKCEIKSALFASGDYSGDRFERVKTIPAYFGKGPVVQWAKNNWSYFPRATIDGKLSPQLSIKLAAHVPGWVYIHFANGAGFPDPFVIGDGKVNWFLKPSKASEPSELSPSPSAMTTVGQ